MLHYLRRAAKGFSSTTTPTGRKRCSGLGWTDIMSAVETNTSPPHSTTNEQFFPYFSSFRSDHFPHPHPHPSSRTSTAVDTPFFCVRFCFSAITFPSLCCERKAVLSLMEELLERSYHSRRRNDMFCGRLRAHDPQHLTMVFFSLSPGVS